MSTHISVSSETQEEIVRKCAVEAHGGGVCRWGVRARAEEFGIFLGGDFSFFTEAWRNSSEL